MLKVEIRLGTTLLCTSACQSGDRSFRSICRTKSKSPRSPLLKGSSLRPQLRATRSFASGPKPMVEQATVQKAINDALSYQEIGG